MAPTEPVVPVVLTAIVDIDVLTDQVIGGEVGIGRHVFHHAGYTKVHLVIREDHLVQGIFIAEELHRHGLADDDRLFGMHRVVQRGARIAP